MNMNDIMKAEVKQIQSANFQSSRICLLWRALIDWCSCSL